MTAHAAVPNDLDTDDAMLHRPRLEQLAALADVEGAHR